MERPGLAGKWKRLKKDQILIGILAGILLLVIALPQGEEEQSDTDLQQDTRIEITGQDNQIVRMELKLQDILEQVEGVGRTKVMITLKSSGRKLVEKDSILSEELDNSGDNGESTVKKTEETTVYQRDDQGNEIPFVVEETAPEIEGVLVAAQGGDNFSVAQNIADVAQALFGVEAHKIKVMKLN